MRLKHFLSVFLTILTLGISQAWADNASVNDVLWGETFDHFVDGSTQKTPSDAGTSTGGGTTIWGSATITYAQSSNNTKGYDAVLAGGTTPELLLSSSNNTWTISGIPTGGATEMALSFKSNKTTFAVTVSDNTNLEVSGAQKSWTISVKEGKTSPSTFNITIKNTGSNNARIDDVALIVVTAAAGGGTPEPSLTLSPSSVSVGATSVANQSVTLTPANFAGSINSVTTGLYSDAGCNTEITSGEWVKDITVNAGKTAVTFNVDDNDGAQRQCWMKITASDGTGNALAVLPITQAVYVAPPTPAALPFSFTGGRADIADTDGMTYDGLGTDYTGSGVTTKLKFDGTGDNVIINFNAAPGKLTYDIKGNSFSGGTFKVQESANGSTYTDVATYTTLGDADSKENDLAQTTRYVKFIYTEKSTGNVGLGNIGISVYVAPAAVATPTISGAENFVTSTTVTLACATDGATIYYTTDGSDPKTSATKQTGTSFTLTNTATVRAIANKGSDWSNEATQKTFTKITPITVATAIGSIPNVDDAVDNQYVVGIVCTAGTSVNGSGQMTYYISDDGSETSRLQIYLGKNLDNSSFTATSDLALGDRVVVYGQLKNFKGTKEMNSGNYLIEKEDAVVSAPVFTPNGGGFMGETNVTITCATGSSNIYYTTDGSTTPSKSSTPYTEPIHLNATTTIKAIAYVGDDASVVITKSFTLTAPMTVAEALTALDSQDPINNAAVVGIISTAPASNPSSGKLTYYISDDGTTDDELEVYLGFGLNGASFSNKTDLQVGDQVTVFGNLTIFSTTTKEFAQGSRLIAFNRPAVDLNSITLPTTANVKVGKTVTLTPTFDPTNATDKTVSWTSDDELIATVVDGVVTGVAAGTVDITVTYTADPTIKATCAVTVSEAPSFDDPTNEWQLVTSDAQLVAGKYYVIVSSSKNKTATSTITSGYTGEASSTVTDGAIAYDALGANTAVFQLGGNSIDGWTLNEVVAQDKLLGGATTANLTWGTGTTTWPITIDASNNAIIGASDGYRILHNVNNNRFKPYNSATSTIMLLPQLYVWTLKTYKLRYNANGGEDAPATQSADGEGKATVTTAIPTAPTDKVFERWNTQYDGNGTDKAAGDVIDLSTADVTLYAIWRDPETVTISYDANGGEGSIDADVDQVEGTQYTIKANTFTRDGYSFIGWKAYDALDNELTITAKKITVPATNVTIKAQWGEIVVSDFVLVTDVNQLKDGDKVYIAAAGYDRAMGTQNTNYRNEVGIGKESDFLTIMGAAPVEFTLGKDGDKYTFNDGTGYLYAAGTANSGKNYINTKDTYDDACDWTITIDENKTVISSVKNNYTPYMQYNSASTRFSCYHTESMQAVVLYKAANYIRSINAGRFGTICMPNSGVMAGADIFEVAYYGETSKKIFFDEVLNGEMEAGRPYIFLPKADASKLAVVYTDDADAAATSRNGLVGFIGADEDDETSVPEGMYILQNNQYREVLAGADARIKSYRAYINLGAITPTAPALAPGRRRISMGVASENSATGMDELNASETPVKMMIDGQLYILRGEKLYDATGRLVK